MSELSFSDWIQHGVTVHQGVKCNRWNNHFGKLISRLSLQLHGGYNSQIRTVQTNGSEIFWYPTRRLFRHLAGGRLDT